MKHALPIILGPIVVLLAACHGGSGEKADTRGTGTEAVTSSEITLTRDQFDAAGMEVGDPSLVQFSDDVAANGVVVAAIGGSARINTLVPGRVKQIYQAVGEQVKRGETLFTLESNEIIMLQQEYAGVFHRVALLEGEYERQKTLYEEKVLAQKDFLRTRSEYQSALAEKKALAARLEMIRIDPSEVEDGKIAPYLSIQSPISGTVTRQELVLGQFIEPQLTVMEIVDAGKLQLTLRVFEQDLEGVAVGQPVHFNTPDQPDRIFEATLSHVGRSIDPETRAVLCIARLDPASSQRFVNNLYVETRIVTCLRDTRAIPEHAIFRENDTDFVWVKVDEKGDQLFFRKTPVQTGMTRNGFTEVLDEELSSVLLVGAYNLWSEEI
jgi:cobalt-zinc-cadmium efflux system membrane fusion protein